MRLKQKQRPNQRMKKIGEEKALLTNLATPKKSFVLQRLMHDLEEIKNQKVPIKGISVFPLDDNFYEWHANVQGFNNNKYKNAIMHLKLIFPKDYPLSPPKVTVLNWKLYHQNVIYNNEICLDMLNNNLLNSSESGWNPRYTVLSILMQIQAIFLVENLSYSYSIDEVDRTLKNQIQEMNGFECPQCLHKGSSDPFPPLPKTKKNNLTNEEYKQVRKSEICCYYRKLNFQEAPLGIGISISKIPRTGEIRNITARYDYISMKAYTKDRIRTDSNGNRFTHWFPLYFGEKKEVVLKSITDAISMVVKGNTKEFKSDLVYKVMHQFFKSFCLEILNEKCKNIGQIIELMMSIYGITLLLVKKYPELLEIANKNVENFIKFPESRIKDKTPDLSELLLMLSLTNHKIEEILPIYISEQMDRQIFWILQELPKLEELINKSEIDDIRGRICFKCNIIGNQLLLFYYYFIKNMRGDNIDKLIEKLENNFGTLPELEINTHIKEIQKILKIDNYNNFYKFLGLSVPSKEELNQMLKKSFENSITKKYHGKDELRYVPPPKEQIEYYMKKYEPIENLVKEGKLLPSEDPKWKQLVEKLDIYQQFKYANPNQNITQVDLMRLYREKLGEQLYFDIERAKEEKNNNIIGEQINKRKFVKKVEDEEIIQELTWKQFYLKFYIEDYVRFFPYITDLKQLYTLIDLVKDEIVHFTLFASTSGKLTSEFNYLRVIFSRLSSLKYLELVFTKQITKQLLSDLLKGIENGMQKGAKIKHLKIIINSNVHHYSSKELNFLTILNYLPSLEILDLNGVFLDSYKLAMIKNHLNYYKTLKVIDVSNCGLTDKVIGELVNGLMKAINLQKFYVSGNDLFSGVSQILNSLTFQPSIKIIDISKNIGYDKASTADDLYKLIKMNKSLEILVAYKLPKLNQELSDNFFVSLGENSKLKYLDISSNDNFKNINKLGMALAFNALKNGSLTYLDISKCNITSEGFKKFVQGLSVSEEEHYSWYNYQLKEKIKKGTLEYVQKTFNCNLETFVFNGNYLYYDTDFLDPKTKAQNIENAIKTFIVNSKKLDTLIFGDSCYSQFFFGALSEALNYENNLKYLSLSNSFIDNEKIKPFISSFYVSEKDKNQTKEKIDIEKQKPNPNFHIEELDLSNNKLGEGNIETFTKVLKINKTLKKLNLFHNLLDVEGARLLGEALKVNNSLEDLDIGYNRIKKAGLRKIIDALKANKNSHLKYLGLKYNFIGENILSEFIKALNKKEYSNLKLEKISVKNNSISTRFIQSFYEEFSKMKKKVEIDIFDILYFLEKERLERTIWISTGPNVAKKDITYEIQRQEYSCIKKEESHIGIPLFIRKVRGRKTGRKKEEKNKNIFVEFMVPNSVNRIMKVASTKEFKLLNKKRKIFKAGTKPEYVLIKKREQKEQEPSESKNKKVKK